jgi:hypothetical protein
MANFEDSGQYYANDEMVAEGLALSVGSGLIYDISDEENVKMVKKISKEFLTIAKKDIKNDGPCFFGEAAIFTGINDSLVWEL